MSSVFRAARRHSKGTLLAGLVAVAATVAGLYWFQPWKLWVDDRVNEALPGAMADKTEDQAPVKKSGKDRSNVTESGPATIASGQFRSLEHAAHGRALVLELPNGDRFLRFEDFEVSNGPDLKVYLSAAPASSDDDAFDEDFVDLGSLKGNIGDQNYVIPPGIDLAKYGSAVVWCRRFSVGFAVAPLT